MGDEGIKTRLENIASLRKKFVQAHAIVFQSSRLVLNAEGHLRRLRLHPQLLKKANKVRVGGVVENDETCIDWNLNAVFLDKNGVRVSTRSGFTLDESDVGIVAELPSSAHSGYAGTNNGNALPHDATRLAACS